MLALIESVLFCYYAIHNIIDFYPINFDQSSYLPYTYGIYEQVKQNGILTGIIGSTHLATGILFPIQAVLFFLLFGASRLTALLPNLVYFLMLQFISVWSIRSITPRNYLSFLFIGLILSIHTPFYDGGMMDFRIDFLAFCLYGIILATIVKSNFFLRTKWVAVAGLLSIFLFLLRFITLTYLLAAYGLIFLSQCRQSKQRLLNLFYIISAIFIAGIVYVWINRLSLFNYYMVGHVLSEEKNIRASGLGITNLLSHVTFYPNSLLFAHFTMINLIFASIIFIFFISLRLTQNSVRISHKIVENNWAIGYITLLSFLFAPLIILFLDINKSPVVGGIMVMPLIWLFMWSYLYFDAKIKHTTPVKYILYFFTSLVFLFGVYNQINELLHHKSKKQLAELQAITQMYLDIGDYAQTKSWQHINLSDDQIRDYITSGGIQTVYYEIRGKLLNIAIERMGGAIFTITKNEALSSIKQSNVVIFNMGEYSHSYFPFDQSIAVFKPELLAYTKKHFKLLSSYHFKDSTYHVYVRQEA